jgi:DnaK suppressor protein
MTDRPVSSEELDAAEADVEGVERALGRLDDGTYSTCEVCGATIDADRLTAEPTTRTCAAHAG